MGDFYLYAKGFYEEKRNISVSEKITMLLAVGFVELVQKIWRRYLCPQLLENEVLPEYLHWSTKVMFSLNSVYRMGDKPILRTIVTSICPSAQF